MKHISKEQFRALSIVLSVVLLVMIISSCSKNQVKENAPATNILAPGNASFNRIPLGLDSNLFKDMIAYLPLDSNAMDYSGNGNNGAEHFVTSGYITSYTRKSLFNGTTSYIAVPDAPLLHLGGTDFSITATVAPSAFSSSLEYEILDKRGGGANNGWHLALGGAKSSAPHHFIFSTGDGNITIVSKDSVRLNSGGYTINVEYFAAARTVKLYIYDPYHGAVLDTIVKKVPPPDTANTTKVYIGRNNPAIGGDSSYFKGYIYGIRLYTRNLTPAEATRLLFIPVFSESYNPNILAYWPLVRSAKDLSGNNNNGILHNITPAADRFGNAVGACAFNGKNSYISVNDNLALRLANTDFTVNAWVYLNSYNTSLGSEIFSKDIPDAPNSGWAFWVIGNTGTNPGVAAFGPGRGLGTAYGTNPIPLNQWHMITGIYTLKHHLFDIYIDGVLDHSVVRVESPNALISAMLYIGSDGDTPRKSNFFNGRLSDLRIIKYGYLDYETKTSNFMNPMLTAIN